MAQLAVARLVAPVLRALAAQVQLPVLHLLVVAADLAAVSAVAEFQISAPADRALRDRPVLVRHPHARPISAARTRCTSTRTARASSA